MTFWNTGLISSINVSTPDDGNGDALRNSFIKVNENFSNISIQLASVNQDWLNANVQNTTNLNYTNIANLFVANATGTTFNFSGNTRSANIIANTGLYSSGITSLTGNTTVGNIRVTGTPTFAGGNVQVSTHFTPTSNITYDLGSPTMYFRNVYALGTISVNQATLGVNATMLDIPTSPAPGDTNDIGVLTLRNNGGSNVYSFFGHQNSTKNFIYYQTVTDPGAGTGVMSGGVYGNVQFGSQYLSNATASTSTTTGALIVAGGIGTRGSLNVGGNVSVTNSVSAVTINGNLSGTWANISTISNPNNSNGNLTVTAGNVNVSGTMYYGGYQVLTTNTPGITVYTGTNVFTSNVTVTPTWNATSPSTGALVLSNGGAGIAGNVWAGQYVVANSGFVGQLRGDQTNIGNITLGGGTVAINGTTGAINASSLQATSLGVTNITATGTLNFSSATITGLALLTVTNTITTATINAATIGNVGTVLQGTLNSASASQPNITTLGNLTSLSVTGNLTTVSTIYGRGIYDNSNRVVSTSANGGNLTINNGAINLTTHGPGAVSTGSSTAIPVITTDVYGRVTSVSTNAVIAPAGTLTGTTLASGVTSSSLTSVGTLTGLTVAGTAVVTTINSPTIGNIGANHVGTGTYLTSLTAGNLTGTIPSAVLGNSTHYIGTTAIALNRASASQSLTGVSIDGTAGNITAWALNQNLTTTSSPTFAGITVPNITKSGTSGTGDIGSSSNYFGTIYGKATTAQYADLAENYLPDSDYAPGTVVVFGGDKEITITSEFADSRVAGVISTDPAYLMNSECNGLPVALRGRVPVNVVGPVNKGDLLVTADATPGYAASVGNDKSHSISIFAKSLETSLDEGPKVIEAVII